MTYRELLERLSSLSDEQLNCNVTVEDPYEDECFPAELRICGEDHSSLDEDHPVIYIVCGSELGERW
jgi:hypothetical protein